jgi:hypothetical protein
MADGLDVTIAHGAYGIATIAVSYGTLVPIEDASDALRAAKETRAEVWDVLRHVRCAQLDEAVFERLASSFEDRFRVLRLLARGYFPPDRSGRLWDFLGDDLPGVPVPWTAEGDRPSTPSPSAALLERPGGSRSELRDPIK